MTPHLGTVIYCFHKCYCQTSASHLLPEIALPAWQRKLLYDYFETGVKTPAWVEEICENFNRCHWPVIMKIQSYLCIYSSNYLLKQAVQNLGQLLKRIIKKKNFSTEHILILTTLKPWFFFFFESCFHFGIPFIFVASRPEKKSIEVSNFNQLPYDILTDILLWKWLHLKNFFTWTAKKLFFSCCGFNHENG